MKFDAQIREQKSLRPFKSRTNAQKDQVWNSSLLTEAFSGQLTPIAEKRSDLDRTGHFNPHRFSGLSLL